MAAIGRSKANATFFQSHGVDEAQELWYGMDLSPLIQNDECAPEDFVIGFIDRFRDDVRSRIKRYFS